MNAVVRPYDLTRGEQVRSGYFTTLEVVTRHFLSELESYFFDQFTISCHFSSKLSPAGKFEPYLAKIPQPTPIFVVEMSVLGGECLLILENPLSNLILARKELVEQGRAKLPKDFAVTLENYPRLETGVQEIVEIFNRCWNRILPSQVKVKKLVSHRIKAKIMEPGESCVSVQVAVEYKGFKSHLEFCFSAYQLDPILKRYGKKALLTGEPGRVPTPKEPLERIIEQEADYKATAILGELFISRAQLEKSLEKGEVLPMSNELKNLITLELNGKPMLSGEPGVTLGYHSVQINGLIEEVRQQVKARPRPFEKTRFPQG
ncbi:MAG: hypothetical protein A2508_01825 [Candidatus Lambdaproteobacteria bacterium RIFOXYD12_FULL_49_8]|uniref:Flagellar motor switch protein FliN-like C-terminal domain-containing protein n=1 Tax=Candidatus Lambdaproteobacteria bacterium RIFOXYD2_FULL_50_16 TaxID=1817772 RepID=A0A1F6GFD6_9PROT|nr:MAG: hypothetical protein A2527_00705 [Candidatus Lambdaproteobacteria bacterium RIFOXYD2_FULL_50_16]OGG98210.1 MAG: hypothetical protein A2508_01825 [Candidatus Lambdaproteobacteria bacterium RIFOXYD12_FULL_49_8]